LPIGINKSGLDMVPQGQL